jgi:aarF domain-containing kinase
LDFKSEVVNAERTRQLFKEYPHLHIPKNNLLLSSRRTIVMEYIQGIKINELEKLKEQFGDAQRPSQILIEIFAKMIFYHGHVHCDAHPGNILVRPNPSDPK